MKIGIIGLPASGKSSIFQALTQIKPDQGAHGGSLIATVQVPDERLSVLSGLFKPEKTVYAKLEYLLPRGIKAYSADGRRDEGFWTEVRPCSALMQVVRNFGHSGGEAPNPRDDFISLQADMIFADLVVVERRLERLDLDRKRGKKINPEELELLEACLKMLEAEKPLRDEPELAAAPLLRGYTLLSAKPVLVLFNNDDEDAEPPPWDEPPELSNPLVVRGKLEVELAELSAEDKEEFLVAYDITDAALNRVIRHSCKVLGLIAFFTVMNKEARCWLIPAGTTALDAAEVIHSDMKKGFIRSETVACEDLMAAGSYQQAKKEGKVRLEGKTYVVQDGDIISFHFNV